MKLIIFVTFLFSEAYASDSFLKVGYIGEQLHVVGDNAYVIASGIDNGSVTRPASVSTIDLLNFELTSQTKFPVGLNIYRGAIDGRHLWVSEWRESKLFKLGLGTELSKTEIQPAPFYETVTESRAMGPVVRVDGPRGKYTWMAYANMKPDWSGYDPGEVVIVKEVDGKPVIAQILQTGVVNPKNMTVSKSGKVFISVGRYKNRTHKGQVIVVDSASLPYDGSRILLNRIGSRYHQAYDLEGTPGATFFDERTSELYVCDLELGGFEPKKGKRFHQVNLMTNDVKTYSGGFNSCGSILVENDRIYVLNLNGGGEYMEEKHLYVYQRKSGREICSKTLKPGAISAPIGFFPNDLKLYKRNLLVNVSGFSSGKIFPALLIKLPLSEEGLPEDCH